MAWKFSRNPFGLEGDYYAHHNPDILDVMGYRLFGFVLPFFMVMVYGFVTKRGDDGLTVFRCLPYAFIAGALGAVMGQKFGQVCFKILSAAMLVFIFKILWAVFGWVFFI